MADARKWSAHTAPSKTQLSEKAGLTPTREKVLTVWHVGGSLGMGQFLPGGHKHSCLVKIHLITLNGLVISLRVRFVSIGLVWIKWQEL